MRGYICGTLDLKGKAQKASTELDFGQGEDTEFLEAKQYHMIFGGS
jgi:hypothetical protein